VNHLIRFISLILLLTFFYSTPIAIAEEIFENPLVLSYQVRTSNNATNRWYNADYSEYFNYHVTSNSFIYVTLTDIDNSSTTIDIAIGNLSRSDISDNEAEEALAIGYFSLPNHFGFISNTSWNQIENDFASIDFNSSSFQSNLKDTYLGKTIDVVVISFVDKFQNTTLIYEKEYGILLYTRTAVFNFLLEIELEAINNDKNYFTKSTTGDALIQPPMILFIATLFLIIFVRQRKYFKW
jgi:hypothetical protein